MTVIAYAILGCGEDPAEPDPHPSLQIIAGAGITDTIDSRPIQALIVKVTVPTGNPSGVVVRFQGGSDGGPYMLVRKGEASTFGLEVIDTTDLQGRASAQVQLGHVAGQALVRISVPESGLLDSASYSIEPGAPQSLVLEPLDTALRAGRSMTARGKTRDRHGNMTDVTSVSYLALTPGVITVDGPEFTARAVGIGQVLARYGQLDRIIRVFVVPNGILAAVEANDLLIFATDGSDLRRIPLGPPVQTSDPTSFTTDWSSDGTEVALDRWIVNLESGQKRSFPGVYPRYSADGQWLYYEGGGSVRRVRVDGTEDEPVSGVPEGRGMPAPSPDGRFLAVADVSPQHLEILELTSGILTMVASPAHYSVWTPDGRQLAIFDPWNQGISLISPDGTGRIGIGAIGYMVGHDLSPDGRWLVAYDGRLQLISLTTGLQLPLHYATGWRAPSWKP